VSENKIMLSAAVSGERAEFAGYRIEEIGSKSGFVRAAVDALMEQDDSYGEDSDDGDLPASESDTPELVAEDTSGEKHDLTDPESDLFDPDVETEVKPSDLDGWKESDAISKQYSGNADGRVGRKYVYYAVLQERMLNSRRECVDKIQRLGVSERTAERAIDRLVNDGLLFPHPTTKDGVLSDELMNEIRLKLAEKEMYENAKEALTPKEKQRYPPHWPELLHGFEEYYESRYYTDKKRYMAYFYDFLEEFLTAVTQKYPASRNTKGFSQASIEDEEELEVLRLVGMEIGDEADLVWDDFDRLTYTSVLMRAKDLTASDKGTEKFVDVKELTSDFLIELDRKFAEQFGDDVESGSEHDYDMSVDDAQDVMGIDDPEEMSPENINSMYRSKTKTDHPDQGGDQEEFKKLKKAKNVLVDVAKASDGGGSNDSNFGVST